MDFSNAFLSQAIKDKVTETSLISRKRGGREKKSRLAARKEKWDAFKDEVYRMHSTEKKTLPDIMAFFHKKYNFKASERTWKSKMKEWGFEKNLRKEDMAWIVAKAAKRQANDSKKTDFSYKGSEVTKEKIANFKKRKQSIDVCEVEDAATPAYITYQTPKADEPGDLSAEVDVPCATPREHEEQPTEGSHTDDKQRRTALNRTAPADEIDQIMHDQFGALNLDRDLFSEPLPTAIPFKLNQTLDRSFIDWIQRAAIIYPMLEDYIFMSDIKTTCLRLISHDLLPQIVRLLESYWRGVKSFASHVDLPMEFEPLEIEIFYLGVVVIGLEKFDASTVSTCLSVLLGVFEAQENWELETRLRAETYCKLLEALLEHAADHTSYPT